MVKASNEIDIQVRNHLRKMKATICMGGIPFEDDRKNFTMNGGTVVVGTIGRVLEFIDKSLIKVGNLSMLILDEGDKLFENKNKKFQEIVSQIVERTVEEKFYTKMLVYSATFTEKLVRDLSKKRQVTIVQTLCQ